MSSPDGPRRSASNDSISCSWLGNIRVGERPLGVAKQLLQALVSAVERIEEGGRVGGVDQAPAGRARRRRRTPGRCARHRGARACRRLSRKPSPSVFQTFTPRAPAAAERRSDSASSVAEGIAGGGKPPVELAEGEEAAGVGAVVALEVRLELGVPAAVEVDRRLDPVVVAELEVGVHLDRPPPRAAPGEVRLDPVGVGLGPASEVGVAVDHPEARTLDSGLSAASAC